MEFNEQKEKYNSTINVIGGVPDYETMIEFIKYECGSGSADTFNFRTVKATSRFRKAVSDAFLLFASDDHKAIFIDGLSSDKLSNEEKLIVIFWQFIFCNRLFSELTEHVFLRALYSGRSVISLSDVEGYIKYLKGEHPEDIPWSDSTIKTTASKYLTVLKKLGMADGKIQKSIHAPHISSSLFVYLIKFALSVHPDENNLENRIFHFSFLDHQSIINRLKSIEYIPLWDISQIGNEVTITLKNK